ncbi:glycosyltransferase family 4 protein [Erythrobacter sp. SDW2]|uniref:glycosyltransferase family 4 protein n=1 Tax=Erythrobacter sp. SDW2 TaxID=2907154 RepID=UPI001F2EADF1|nr:glycosyltransferase family 4 protein [Erythrobacter sp. SDW2]UIP07376.1 glycosyltransferase family 4 protein [Erythrobacter sp. SDW2]
MRIAFDGLNIRKGGGQTVMLRLARAFARAGHGVEIFTGTPDMGERGAALGDEVRFTYIPAAASAFGALKVRHAQWDGLMAEKRCDTAFGFNYWIPTSLPQATYHINVIPFLPFAERRGAVGFTRALIQSRYARAALTRSAVNIFESEHIRDLARQAHGSAIRNPHVRYIGVELPREAAIPAMPARTIAAVTSPALHKHNEYLFDLHRLLAERHPDNPVGLKLIGITPEALDANEHVAARKDYALGQESIDFVGYVDRPRLFAELANSLALVSFSELESFFMVALESMAVGCPAIATDVSSIRESVGAAGLLVPPGDVAAAADHVERLLDPVFRKARQVQGLAWVERFESESCADAIVALCDELAHAAG